MASRAHWKGDDVGAGVAGEPAAIGLHHRGPRLDCRVPAISALDRAQRMRQRLLSQVTADATDAVAPISENASPRMRRREIEA